MKYQFLGKYPVILKSFGRVNVGQIIEVDFIINNNLFKKIIRKRK